MLRSITQAVVPLLLVVQVLNTRLFPCGMLYYEKPKRRMFYFDNPCNECVVMHNNWIVGGEAKVYRFKEHASWFVDKEGYYTSTQGVPSTMNRTHTCRRQRLLTQATHHQLATCNLTCRMHEGR